MPAVLPTGSVVSSHGSSSPLDDLSSPSLGVVQSSSCSASSSVASTPSTSSPTALVSNALAFAELEFGPFVQVYAGASLTHEARGLSPANDYAFRVQVSDELSFLVLVCFSFFIVFFLF